MTNDARTRARHARGSGIQALITFDYWPEHVQRVVPDWNDVLQALRPGEYVRWCEGRRLYRG